MAPGVWRPTVRPQAVRTPLPNQVRMARLRAAGQESGDQDMTTSSLAQLSISDSEAAVMRDISDDGRFVSYVVGNRGTADSGDTLIVKDLLTGAVQTVASFPD